MSKNLNEGKSQILLVEDDENIAKLFMYSLVKAGYDCKLAEDGQQGFDMVKQSRPDLIISDIMMPEVDGFEFREMLIKEKDLKTIPFIFLTAKGAEEDILKGYDLDIQEYILKTSSPKVILAKVSAILKTQVAERKKAEAEVRMAADSMTAKITPDNPPQLDGFRISHFHVPYKKVPGGDFIDYVMIDDDRLAIVLGDVMGKKWGAWYFSIAYAGYVRSAIRFAIKDEKETTASQIMNKVNESIFNDERISEVFVTLSLILIDKKNNIASYSGAGDLPILYHDQKEVIPIQSKGLLLGFNLDGKYEDINIDLKSNDSLFMITDGIIESRNKESGKSFGSESIINAVMNSNEEKKIDTIIEDFRSFTQNDFEDDVSIIEIKVE